ncbi:MAG: amino acid permease [Carboxylicivirga sp.]|jgi:APA family basic amino acid/polyamine antiporter|nr:amino acid permease [Carboxylicivirga sp.]
MADKISGRTAMSLVIANMIGTGVFTTLGFQLVSIQNTWSIILLWSIGAVMAMSGAFSYAELGTRLQRSGGEYHYLSIVYGKFIGYLSGWASMTVGFPAPIALAAMAAGAYTQKYLGIDAKLLASALIISISLVHMIDLKRSSLFQNITTTLKVLLIIGIILLGLSLPSSCNAIDLSNDWQREMLLPSFAVSLVYVSYAFSGWNAAAYIVGEIKNVKRNLPLALIGGTLVVSILYVLLQVVFLKQASISMLTAKVEIGQIVAEQMLGALGAKLISGFVAFMLVSSISAMVWVGPRVNTVMADDYRIWRFLRKTDSQKVPKRPILLQAGIALIMVFTGSFEQVITYSGFILQVFVTLSVLSLFLVKKNKRLSGYSSPLFPLPQIVFLLISGWILIYLMINQPFESLIGLGIIGFGTFSYYINKKLAKRH